MLAGLAKAGKSWIELYLALCIATGRAAFGRPTTRAKVLIISREDRDRECKRRIELLMRGLGIEREDLRGWIKIDCTKPLYFDRPVEVARLERTLVSFAPKVVFIDSLSRIHMQNENDRSEMACVTNLWSDLCGKYNVAVVILHHVVKMGEGRSLMQKIRGTGDIPAVVRMGIGVEKMSDGSIVIETDGNMADMAHEFKVRRVDYDGMGAKITVEKAVRHSIVFEPVGGTGIVGNVEDELSDPIIGELVDVLHDDLRTGLGEMAGVVTKTNLRKGRGGSREVDPRIEIMEKHGIIEKAKQGRKTIGYRLTAAGVQFAIEGSKDRRIERAPTISRLMDVAKVPVH